MKVVILAVLAFCSLSVQGSQDGDHPYGVCRTDSGETNDWRVYLPDNRDCQKYYICAEGKPVPQFCFPGQHWNLKKNRCDFPANAECVRPIENDSGEEQSGDKSAETTSNEDSGATNSSAEKNSEENKSNEVQSGEEVPSEEAKSGELTSEEDSGEKHLSAENISSENSAEVVSVRPEDPCDGQTTEKFLAHNVECGKFYVCTGSASILMSCPRGLYFNPVQKLCDLPQNTECGVAKDPNNPCADKLEGQFFAHELNCGQYYRCVDGEARLMVCPTALHFNAELSVCDWPENVKC